MKKSIIIISCLLVFLTTQNINAQDFVPVTYKVEAPEQVNKKESFKITANFDTNGEWYIYAPTGQNEKHGMIETKLNFNLPTGITLGEKDLPVPKPYGMYQIYQGDEIKLSQNFIIDQNIKSGEYLIECIVTYQTCNKSVCLPPNTKSYKKTILIN